MKVYLSNINESWVVDRFRDDWYKENLDISTEDKNLEKMTFFIQQMLNKGILASNRFYANYCHNDVHLEIYKQSAQEIFALINRFSNSDNLNKEIIGEPMNPGFHRFN